MGKIINLEFDDLVLFVVVLDIVYEFFDESFILIYGVFKIISGSF